MTAICLAPAQPAADVVVKSPPLDEIRRPPTVFGRHSPRWLVQAGHSLARRAIGYRMEKVPFEESVEQLLPANEATLQMARDYLAFTRFACPLDAQVDALAIVDDAIYRVDQEAKRRSRTPSAWLRRLGRRLRRRRRTGED